MGSTFELQFIFFCFMREEEVGVDNLVSESPTGLLYRSIVSVEYDATRGSITSVQI